MDSQLEVLALTEDGELAAATASAVISGPDRALTELVNAAVRQRCVLRVARQLEDQGVDLAAIQVGRAALASAKLPIFLLGMDTEGPVDLGTVRDLLVRHREVLLDVVSDLALAHPREFVVVYGLGLSLVSDRPAERESSDLDLYIEQHSQAALVLDHLVANWGVTLAGSTDGRGAGSDLTAWKASTQVDGHAVLIDGFTAGRPSSGHQWIPPLRLPAMFGNTTEVTLASGGVALVPSPEDMLVMLAEKIQRKGDFSIRRMSDALALTKGDVAWDEVLAHCGDVHVGLGLDWIVTQLERVSPGRVPSEVREQTRLAGWERWAQRMMQASNPTTRRRARSLHRRWWVTRYVASHSNRRQALIEVGSGRYLRPQRTGFHHAGPEQ